MVIKSPSQRIKTCLTLSQLECTFATKKQKTYHFLTSTEMKFKKQTNKKTKINTILLNKKKFYLYYMLVLRGKQANVKVQERLQKELNSPPPPPLIVTCTQCLLSPAELFATLQTVVHQAPLSLGFSRQEYWSGLPFCPPGDLLNPGIKPTSPALRADSLPLSHLQSLKIKDFPRKECHIN